MMEGIIEMSILTVLGDGDGCEYNERSRAVVKLRNELYDLNMTERGTDAALEA